MYHDHTFLGADALGQRKHGLVDVGHEHAVGNEAGRVKRFGGDLEGERQQVN